MTAAIGIVALLALTLLAARLLERSMVFFPAPYPSGEWEPRRLGVVASEYEFRSADGHRLYGWWFPGRVDAAAAPGAEQRVPVLLWAHGNAGNLTGRAPHAHQIASRGVSVFVFDYRGYGKSEGQPSEEGIYRDAEAAYAFVTEQLDVQPQRLVLLGRSLGSAPAARLARQLPHAGLVLVSPLPSARSMARRMFGGLPVDWLVRSRFPVSEWVGERHGDAPLLVIHGDRDEIIPIEYGREVFDAAAEPKRFLQLEGAGHNNILMFSGDAYLGPLVEFAHAAVETACAERGC